MISAKRMDWDTIYDYFPFPTDKYSKEDALNQFIPVQRETMKNKGNGYPFTAYEFQGEEYYSLVYDGTFDEEYLLNQGFSKEDLNDY